MYAQKSRQRVRFNKEAKNAFISFATSNEAVWAGNFRDLSSAITRLCTLADSSRISVDDVNDEIEWLRHAWYPASRQSSLKNLEECLSTEQIEQLDQFDANQLSFVLSVCKRHNSMASAGRELFDISRTMKSQPNDSSRLQKYLAKFGLKWGDL
ncbi:MAG: hypothetical protein MK214_17750 [Thalassotalea sp.]|nr:hypothetical protein [Thalassotalea sp.]